MLVRTPEYNFLLIDVCSHKTSQLIEDILPILEQAVTNGDIGSALHKTTSDIWSCVIAQKPSLKENLLWWITTGQNIKTAINGRTIMSLGCPKGPMIGKALAKAQYAAWNGMTHEKQIEEVTRLWKN